MIKRPNIKPKGSKASHVKRGGQINEILRSGLAQLVEERLELPGVLVTIVAVKSEPDLKFAEVFVSILPEKFTGTALEALRKHSAGFAKALSKRTKLRSVPHFSWLVDNTEVKAAEIDELFKNLQ